MKILKIITLLLFVTLTFSCRWFTDGFGKPLMFGAGYKIPPGSPAFQAGFKDGCEQMYYSRGNMFHKTFYKYHYDPKMNGNKEYRFGYKRGATYCFNMIVPPHSGPQVSADRYLFPYKDDDTGFVFGGIAATDYNTVGDGGTAAMFGGIGAPGNPVGPNFNSIFGVWGANSPESSALGSNPLWAGGSKGQFFGQ